MDSLLTADLEVTSKEELDLVIEFCQELLRPSHSAADRERLWFAAGADWSLEDNGTIAIAEFMLETWSQERKRRFG